MSQQNFELFFDSFYQQVAFTNATFGNAPLDLRNEESWRLLHSQALLIKEEFQELLDAQERKDVRDAVADIYVTALGLVYFMGISEAQIDAALPEPVHESIGSYGVKEQLQAALNELFEELEKKNAKAMQEILGRMIQLNGHIPRIFLFDAKRDMFEVFLSNLSKVCKTKEDAALTIAAYAKKGVLCAAFDCPTMPGAFIVKVTEDCYDLQGKRFPKNKFLKCVVSFREPKFTGD